MLRRMTSGGFLAMILSVLGVVLYVTMFGSILDALVDILEYAHLSTFTALSTVVGIAPTVLLLGGVGVGGFTYYKGYKAAGGGADQGGLMRMVLGILIIILFATLFLTILSSMYTLYSHANVSSFTAFTTVVSIMPTVLFLGGIFAGAATAVSGYRARRRRRYLR